MHLYLWLNDNLYEKTNPNTNPITKGEQDRNSKILAHLGALRSLTSSFRGGDNLRLSLAKELDNITNTISNAQGALYNISSYRDSRR